VYARLCFRIAEIELRFPVFARHGVQGPDLRGFQGIGVRPARHTAMNRKIIGDVCDGHAGDGCYKDPP
jgi:hypothetical protein